MEKVRRSHSTHPLMHHTTGILNVSYFDANLKVLKSKGIDC